MCRCTLVISILARTLSKQTKTRVFANKTTTHKLRTRDGARLSPEWLSAVGRWAAPEEVAHAILFLAEERNGFITGAILTVKIIYELQRTGGKYGLVTMCIGGGQGIAMVVERV